MLAMYSSRAAWRNLPPVSSHDTRQVLKQFSPSEQKQLLNEISGAYQMAEQQVHWNTEAQVTCVHCEADDTKAHRLFECPVTQQQREPFQATLEYFQDTDIAELPVVHCHPQTELLRTMCWYPSIPDIHPDIYRTLRDWDHQGSTLTFYTDGACLHPTDRYHRHAAFSVVIDLALTDAERLQQVRLAAINEPVHTLLPIALCQSSGLQNIHRAEIEAHVYICERFQHTTIHTDSAVALSLDLKCQRAQSLHELRDHPEYDLAQRLWIAMQTGTHNFHKVKAHALDVPDANPLDTYHKLGNQVADRAANRACRYLSGNIATENQAIMDAKTTHTQHLIQLYKLYLQLFRQRAQVDRIAQRATVPQDNSSRHQQFVSELKDYAVDPPWSPPDLHVNNVDKTAWGPWLSGQLLQWMQAVKWPQRAEQHTHQQLGITWLELSLSFAHWIGMYIPVKRIDAKGIERLVTPNSYHMAKSMGMKLSEHAHSFSIWFRQFTDLHDQYQWPDVPRGMARSLYVLGSGHFTSGFLWRPQFPYQQQVTDTMLEYLRIHKGYAFTALPDLAYTASPETITKVMKETEGKWQVRCQEYQRLSREMRQWKASRSTQRQLSFAV